MNYYELKYLKPYLKNKLTNSYFEKAITPYKNLLEFFFGSDDSGIRLIFSSAPSNTALFLDTYRPGKKSNALQFFEVLQGKKVSNVRIPESDRWLYIDLEDGYTLQFRLFSNRANVFLTKEGSITEVFKEYDEPGEAAPAPQTLDLFSADPGNKSPKNKITALDPMFPRENIPELIDHFALEQLSNEEIIQQVKEWDRILREGAEFRILENGNTTLFPEHILPVTTVKKLDSINDLIRWRYKNYSNAERLRQKRSRIQDALQRKVKRLTTSLNNLSQADKGLERAEKYEQWGHMLMAHAHEETGSRKEMEVQDLYGSGELIRIPVKSDMDVAANAQRYYSKAQNARTSYEQAQKRIPKLKKEKEMFEALLGSLQEQKNIWQLNDWVKDHEEAVEQVLQTGHGKSDQDTSAYHVIRIEDYECWIGKNAKSNDKLLQAGHKEDVWMHARGVPGSHLLIRMENDKGMPPKKILLKAASYAAWNSKAKGSRLAPVMITKKKYVRKPKGAAAGAVLVDKEDVEMVSPKKPNYE